MAIVEIEFRSLDPGLFESFQEAKVSQDEDCGGLYVDTDAERCEGCRCFEDVDVGESYRVERERGCEASNAGACYEDLGLRAQIRHLQM